MGILCSTVTEETTMIKAAIVACLAALAAAEADADALYGRYGYGAGLGYSGYASGLGYSGYGYAAAPYRYNGAYGYAAPATSAGITVRGYGTPATVGTNAPYGYAASGQYVADSFGAVHIAKREAEAEPEADADAAYGTYGGYGLDLGYSSYAAPAIARTAVASYAAPVISRPAIASYAAPAVASYAAPAVAAYAAPTIATGYAGIARPAISSYAGYGYGR